MARGNIDRSSDVTVTRADGTQYVVPNTAAERRKVYPDPPFDPPATQPAVGWDCEWGVRHKKNGTCDCQQRYDFQIKQWRKLHRGGASGVGREVEDANELYDRLKSENAFRPRPVKRRKTSKGKK